MRPRSVLRLAVVSVLLVPILCNGPVRAAKAPSASTPKDVEARIFGAYHSVEPGQINAQMNSDSLGNYSSVLGGGLEAVRRWAGFISLGVRLENRFQRADSTSQTSTGGTNPYYSSLQQKTYEPILRITTIDLSFMRADIFGTVGLAETTLDVRSAAGEGTYESKNSTVSKAGASLGFGFANVYLTVEGGYETNVVSGLSLLGRTGTTIRTLELSGPFVTVGLLFAGSPDFLTKK